MLTKIELDLRVATALGLPKKVVANVTDAFVDELCTAIAKHGGFQLDGLGKLIPRLEKGSLNVRQDNVQEPMRIRVYFTKSPMLKDQIERHYGLVKE
jgi:nucleoid DNA-binding protein